MAVTVDGKAYDLPRLAAEIEALGVPLRGLGYDGSRIHTYNAVGAIQPFGGSDLQAVTTVMAAHVSPVPVDYGTEDGLSDRAKIASAIQSIRAYQGLAAGSVTQGQRKAYEDLIGSAVIALARRVLGSEPS